MLKLRAAFSQNPRIEPLLDGTVKPAGIELEFELGVPGAMFERHLRDDAFEVFEFSISDYLIIRQRPDSGKWSWTAIPIFLRPREFLALDTYVHVDSGIESFADLRGKRFGVPDFNMTAALWMRAMVRHLYGIQAHDVSWYVGRSLEHSHGALLGIDREPPPGLSLTWLNEDGGLNRLLHAGEIDAAYGTTEEPLFEGPELRQLLPDRGLGWMEEFHRSTGFTPLNHTVALQRRLVEREPWVAGALYEAFEASKQDAYRRDPRAALLFPDHDPGRQRSVFGDDPYRSGLGANRSMLQMAAEQSHAEGLTPAVADVDELFWESVRGT